MNGSFLLLGMAHTWIMPIWLLCIGAALGLVVLVVAYGVMRLVAPRAAEAALSGVLEGSLLPLTYLAAAMTAFAILAPFLVPQLPVENVTSTLERLPRVGTHEIEFTIPAETRGFKLPFDELPYKLRTTELSRFTLASDQPLLINTNIVSGLGQFLTINVPANEESSWDRPVLSEKDRSRMSPQNEAMEWTATNVNPRPATLKIVTHTNVEFPEVFVMFWTALALVGLVAAAMAMRWLMPKVSAIALTTAKESMSQPLFYVVLSLGAFALLVFIFIPYHTFGEDVKMLKDSGLTLIMVLAIILAVWSASISVSEEVEGRTALTVLSKPVERRQFILGKFLGVLGPVIVLFIVLGFLLLVTVSYKVVYDARETSRTEPTWQMCYLEMIRIVPGLVLAFFETVVLAAISVAISTRLPMLANLIVCATIYVLGHMVPMLVNSSVGRFEIVRFVGQFIATVLPVLDHFNIQAAVAAGAVVPLQYLALAGLYCILYSTIAMLLGLALFEDRDLA